MIVLGIHSGNHNGSVALLKDGEILFHIENERLSDIKHDKYIFKAIEKVKDYVDHIDHLALSGFKPSGPHFKSLIDDAYIAQIYGLGKSFYNNYFEVHDLFKEHHIVHGATAFYNSGFDKALCIVTDGAGSPYIINVPDLNIENEEANEIKTSFIMEYPAKVELLNKEISYLKTKLDINRYHFDEKVSLVNTASEAAIFEYAAYALGFTYQDAGKVMGMAPYGGKSNIYPNLYEGNLINKNCFTYKIDKNGTRKYEFNFNIPNNFKDQSDLAHLVQTQTQEAISDYIVKQIEKSGQTNLCLSGGFFLNCVSNYNLLNKLSKKINIYIEPMCGDGGNSIGAAMLVYHRVTNDNKIKQRSSIYYGPKNKYSNNDIKNENIINNVSPYDVAKIISEKKIVAIFQGQSEGGPRALGNRSILYDPRDINGKDHVNVVKKRESFRPFAGSVLQEYANDWFDLKNLKESKYMMFAVDVLKNKQHLIPAITHIDGTCRIQTVENKDNPIFYNLINEFYKITNIPILFNTSFNLAGHAIVETLNDALWTLHNSKIDYLYLPELEVLVHK